MSGAASLVEEGVERWRGLGLPEPEILVVSGSGLAVPLDGEPLATAPLERVLPFPAHRVEGHPHEVETSRDARGRVVAYQRGRLHGYQGYSPSEVVCLIRIAARLGARTLIMTNAAGGIDPERAPGDLVVLRDHLNLTGANPLRGELPLEWGPRFPDMSEAYPQALRRLAREEAGRLAIPLSEGVYAGLAGPAYETPAEVRMLRTLGADLGGMSTVHEVIAATHMGLRCLCFSLVTNRAAGLSATPLTHEEVLEVGRQAAEHVQALLQALLSRAELTA
ncbi:MAG: purine-nucleoside phosphorylase [Thermoanaerobaculia bacterium]